MERLQRVLAARGVTSRRAAEALISAGRVTVDGKVVTERGTRVDPRTADIRVDGRPVQAQRLRYLLLNKPRGFITTTHDERDHRTVMDLVELPERIYPVGRLDRQTEGALLLTNDGEVANRVMHPRYELDKEYNVLTLSRPSDATLRRVRGGVVIDGRRIVPGEFRILRASDEGLILKIVIHEGIYHVVRRIMEEVDIPVERLRRVRVGPLSIAGIPPGEWRDLTTGELNQLLQALHLEREEGAMPSGARFGPRRPRREPIPVGLGLESDEWEGGPIPPGRRAVPIPSADEPRSKRQARRAAARRGASRRGLPGSENAPQRASGGRKGGRDESSAPAEHPRPPSGRPARPQRAGEREKEAAAPTGRRGRVRKRTSADEGQRPRHEDGGRTTKSGVAAPGRGRPARRSGPGAPPDDEKRDRQRQTTGGRGPLPTRDQPGNRRRAQRPNRGGQDDAQFSQRGKKKRDGGRDRARTPGPHPGGRDRRPGRGRQNDRGPGPRRPPRGDAV